MLLFVVLAQTYTFNLSEFLLQVVHFRHYPMAQNLHVVDIFELEILELLYLLLHQVVPLLRRTAVECRNELLQQLVQTPSHLPHGGSPTHHPLKNSFPQTLLSLCYRSLTLNLSTLPCNYLGNRHKQLLSRLTLSLIDLNLL